MSAENKVTMTRVIVGVASVGATLALVYLYNKYQERKNKAPSSSSSVSRARRQSANSGTVKKVTFKTSEDDEKGRGGGGGDEKSVNNSPANHSKSKSSLPELIKEPSKPVLKSPSSVLVASHDATEKSSSEMSSSKVVEVEGPSREVSSSSSSTLFQSALDGSLNCSGHHDTTNIYESNSTLKLEDSSSATVTAININNESVPSVVATPAAAAAAPVEEVITASPGGPLMTSTPLASKDLSVGHVPLRTSAAVFDRTSSDLRTPAEKSEGVAAASSASAITPETDYDGHQMRKEVKIPRDLVPGLIGKKGCNIKGIQAQSNTTIVFSDETLENGDRLCVIRGAPGDVTYADSLIEKYIMDQPPVFTERLTVPLSSVGRIIGKGGDTIRHIQDLSKARVNVESHNHYGENDAGPPTRVITIKGTDEQINIAKQLIIEKVDEEQNLRKTIHDTTAGRTHRRGGRFSPTSHNAPGGGLGASVGSSSGTASSSAEQVLPLKQDGILEVFVSCVYHPNDFWIQVVGRDAIELDKLCENMTDHYKVSQTSPSSEPQFSVGDIVAAPFEVDGKIYRAKIMRMDDNGLEVSYLDYGDRRVLSTSDIYELDPKFLHLRFQAMQATLNLGCIGEKWEDEVINEFCDLTYCAQWQSLTAKIKNYLKDVEDGHDVICIELLDKDINIGEELVRKGLATPKGPSGINGAQGVQRKSYAAAALGGGGGPSSSAVPTGPVISSSDPTVQESMESDRNGN